MGAAWVWQCCLAMLVWQGCQRVSNDLAVALQGFERVSNDLAMLLGKVAKGSQTTWQCCLARLPKGLKRLGNVAWQGCQGARPFRVCLAGEPGDRGTREFGQLRSAGGTQYFGKWPVL